MFSLSTALNKKDEEIFIEYLVPDARRHLRFFCVAVVILFVLFGFLDERFSAENISILFAIRYYITIPLIAIIFVVSYTQLFAQISQFVSLTAFLIVGAGTSVIILLAPEVYINYGLLLLALFGGFVSLRLKFIYAAIGGWLIIAGIAAGLIVRGGLAGEELVAIAALMVATGLIGMSGNHYINETQRKNYLQRQQGILDKKHLERMMSEKVKEISDSQSVTIFALAKLSESRDKETGNHIERVGKYCTLLASKIDVREYEKRGINKEDFVSRIELASALHDIGKVGVGDAILIKPGKLNAEEFELMTCHTLIGSNTLDEVRKKYPNNSFINMGIEITRYHHEKFDGSGYPYGLAGEKIPLSARIMAIADVYDALISVRPYKPAYTHERAVDIITNLSGQQFDPMLIKIFEESERDIKSIAYGHQHPI